MKRITLLLLFHPLIFAISKSPGQISPRPPSLPAAKKSAPTFDEGKAKEIAPILTLISKEKDALEINRQLAMENSTLIRTTLEGDPEAQEIDLSLLSTDVLSNSL